MSESHVHTDSPTLQTAHQSDALGRIPKPSLRVIQIILGLFWILAGALQYQPFMFSKSFVTQIIAPVAQGQPSSIGASITWSTAVMGHHIVLYNAMFATIQVLIGVGLLFRRSVKAALVVSFAWALGVWWFGEGLGMIPTGMASPLTGAPGAVLLYGLVGALVWPARSGKPKAAFANDAVVQERAVAWAAPVGRIAWAALWLMAAALWLLPANRSANSFHDQVLSAPYGWLASIQHAIANASNGSGLGIAVVLALVSIAIGVGIFFPATFRLALVIGAVVSLAYWALGQSFGLLTTGMATDVNAGPLFLLLALRLWSDPAQTQWRFGMLRTQQPDDRSVLGTGRPPERVGVSQRVPIT